uniref:Uncharacterized protein n=1 Tax=Anguilla anguilla TaxID=7936 RepID=A0A0E9Y0J8_ANGAN
MFLIGGCPDNSHCEAGGSPRGSRYICHNTGRSPKTSVGI